MDILQTALETAEAIGMELTHTESVCFDVLKGYNYDELVSLCDKKGLDKFIKEKTKQALTEKTDALFLKPILVKSDVHLVLGKTTSGELMTSVAHNDYRFAITSDQPNVKLASQSDLTESFLNFRTSLAEKVHFAQSLLPKLANSKLERVDEQTNWDMGLEQRVYSKVILDNSKELEWGFKFFKVVYLSEKDGTELVIPCLMLKSFYDLKLIKGV